MRKQILAALLGISLLPMAPPASPRLVLPSMTLYSHRAGRGNHWRYW